MGEHRPFVTELLGKVHASGYAIIGNISGKGHHGLREAHFMFSEQESQIMIMAVVPVDKVEPILAGLQPLFERCSGVMFVSDVAVSRREHFSTPPAIGDRLRPELAQAVLVSIVLSLFGEYRMTEKPGLGTDIKR